MSIEHLAGKCLPEPPQGARQGGVRHPLGIPELWNGCCVVLGAWWGPIGIYQDPFEPIWTHWDPFGLIRGVHGAISLTPVGLVPAPLPPGSTHKSGVLWFCVSPALSSGFSRWCQVVPVMKSQPRCKTRLQLLLGKEDSMESSGIHTHTAVLGYS